MSFTEELSELLHRVPRPPEDAIPAGVTNDDITHFESRTGITLPSMLRGWLCLTNGPCVGPGGFYGIHPRRSHLDIEEYLRQFPELMARKWIPVAGDGCGNIFVIPTQNEFGAGYPVMFVDMETASASPAYIVSSDLEHFIVATLRKEMETTGWPFSQKEVLAFDPQVTSFHGVPFPWDAAQR